MKRSSSDESNVGGVKRTRENPTTREAGGEEMEGPSQSSQATLCRNGCGFYGSPKTDGMCSICYKDTVQKTNNSGRKSPGLSHVASKPMDIAKSNLTNRSEVASAMASLATSDVPVSTTISPAKESLNATSSPIAIPSATNPNTSLTSPSSKNSSFDEAGTSLDDSQASPSKPKKNRCSQCRKRLGLTGFNCRCGKIFCGLHRYSDQHSCEFDYKADGQAKIRKENPVIVGEKINKI